MTDVIHFEPKVNVTVEYGLVTNVTVDWNDCWVGSSGSDEAEAVATEYLDNANVQQAVEAAFVRLCSPSADGILKDVNDLEDKLDTLLDAGDRKIIAKGGVEIHVKLRRLGESVRKFPKDHPARKAYLALATRLMIEVFDVPLEEINNG